MSAKLARHAATAALVGGGQEPVRVKKAMSSMLKTVTSGSNTMKTVKFDRSKETKVGKSGWKAPPEKGRSSWKGRKHKYVKKSKSWKQSLTKDEKKKLVKSRKVYKKSAGERSAEFKKARGMRKMKKTKPQKKKAEKRSNKPEDFLKKNKGIDTSKPKQRFQNCELYVVKSHKFDKENRSKQFKAYRRSEAKKLKKETRIATNECDYKLIFEVGKIQRYQNKTYKFRDYRKTHAGASKSKKLRVPLGHENLDFGDKGIKVIYEVGRTVSG